MLCVKARDIFMQQPILLELEAPIKICGEQNRPPDFFGFKRGKESSAHGVVILYCLLNEKSSREMGWDVWWGEVCTT